MASSNGTNPPYHNDFEPLLAVDSTVEIQPENEVYAVDVVEVLPTIDTQEFTVAAGGELEEEEIRELYVQDSALAQYRLPDVGTAIPDGVEIRVDHGGEESPRFNNKNSRGYYSSDTPSFGDAAQQTELFQFEDTDLFFSISNTSGSEVTFSLTYSGWVYRLSSEPDVPPTDADQSVLAQRTSFRR